MLRSVAALVTDGMAFFEFGVICEVFGLDRTDDGLPPVDFRVCGVQPGEHVRTSVGASLTPEHGLDAAEDADLVVAPTVHGEYPVPPQVFATLRRAHERGATLLSVCSGAYVLAEAGLLEGRTVTTHWRFADDLARRYPGVRVDPDVLFVDDGDIVTSAGTAAGIDACLHVVRRSWGSHAANLIARRMVVAPQRPGGQRQFIERPVPTCNDDSLAAVLDHMAEQLDAPHTVASLARRATMSERTFARAFVAQTGTTPLAWLTAQRVVHAQTLLEETSLDVEEIARRCGYGSGALLRHHFRRAVGITPAEYRQGFRYVA